MKIILFDNIKDAVTGGEKYNAMFVNILAEHLNAEVIRNEADDLGYRSWRKSPAAFQETKRLKICQKGDYLIFPDTSYGRLFLSALFSRFKFGCKSLIIIHHFPYLNESGTKRVLEFIKQYLYYALIKEVITPNKYTLDIAHKLFPLKNIINIPLPFDLSFSPSERYVIGDYLYVGTIERRKGLSYLLNALAYIKQENSKEFNLHIVGKTVDENYYSSLIKQSKELGIEKNIHFHGRMSQTELEEMFANAEIFTFPSLLEGFGMVIIEAMSHGVPVVAFNNSAMPYTIKHNHNGLLAENKNPRSFADQILLLHGNKELRKNLQKGMENTIQHISTRDDFERAIEKKIIHHI